MYKKIILACTAGLLSLAAIAAGPHDKPGFVTKVEDGRLWVFKEGSKELEQFEKHGEPAISVANIGAGPEGMTIKAPSQEVLEAYQGSK